MAAAVAVDGPVFSIRRYNYVVPEGPTNNRFQTAALEGGWNQKCTKSRRVLTLRGARTLQSPEAHGQISHRRDSVLPREAEPPASAMSTAPSDRRFQADTTPCLMSPACEPWQRRSAPCSQHGFHANNRIRVQQTKAAWMTSHAALVSCHSYFSLSYGVGTDAVTCDE